MKKILIILTSIVSIATIAFISCSKTNKVGNSNTSNNSTVNANLLRETDRNFKVYSAITPGSSEVIEFHIKYDKDDNAVISVSRKNNGKTEDINSFFFGIDFDDETGTYQIPNEGKWWAIPIIENPVARQIVGADGGAIDAEGVIKCNCTAPLGNCKLLNRVCTSGSSICTGSCQTKGRISDRVGNVIISVDDQGLLVLEANSITIE